MCIGLPTSCAALPVPWLCCLLSLVVLLLPCDFPACAVLFPFRSLKPSLELALLSGHAQVRLMPIPSSKMHPRNRSPCQPIARPAFSRTRPLLSSRALRSARDHDFEVATHTNARDPILDPEIIALATDISFGKLSILELPIALGIV